MPHAEFLRENRKEITFHFRCECEDCDADGELTLLKADGMRPFNCPEGCGAVYVPWRPQHIWILRCVIKPSYWPRAAGPSEHEILRKKQFEGES